MPGFISIGEPSLSPSHARCTEIAARCSSIGIKEASTTGVSEATREANPLIIASSADINSKLLEKLSNF